MALFGRKKKVDEVAAEVAPSETLPEAADTPQERRTVEAHRNHILGQVEPLPPFGMALLDAWGLGLCESVPAETDLPPFDQVVEDGYAVRAEDVSGATPDDPRGLTLNPPAKGIGTSRAVVVAAGDPLPEGADAVLPHRFVEAFGERLRVLEPVERGQYVQARASLLADGDKVLEQGRVLDARSIALLAESGVDKVLARPRPRVVVLSIGGRLVDPARRLNEPGQVFDSTSFLLAAAAKAAGCQVFRVQVDSDAIDRVHEVIGDQLIRADLILTTGGLGADGVLEQVAAQLGRCEVVDLTLERGSRQGFGLLGDDNVPLLMLPRDPSGALVGYHAFALPVIRTLMGVEPVVPAAVRATTPSVVRSKPGVFQALPVHVRDENGRRGVEFVEGDHATANLACANALVVLAEDAEDVEAGHQVLVWMTDRD